MFRPHRHAPTIKLKLHQAEAPLPVLRVTTPFSRHFPTRKRREKSNGGEFKSKKAKSVVLANQEAETSSSTTAPNEGDMTCRLLASREVRGGQPGAIPKGTRGFGSDAPRDGRISLKV